LKGAVAAQAARLGKGEQSAAIENLEEEYIVNLHKQVALMERELECLKQREIEQKNKAQGYEVLLRDKIPLNEHFLALKNKYNEEDSKLKKEHQFLLDEIRKEERVNEKKEIEMKTRDQDYKKYSEDFQLQKENTIQKERDIQHRIFLEEHTRDVLKVEKEKLETKNATLKRENQVMNRQITKDRYHNDKDEKKKSRKKECDDRQEVNDKLIEEIEKARALLESEKERNTDPGLLGKVRTIRNNLFQDHNKLCTQITVNTNNIDDLKQRRDMVMTTIFEYMTDIRGLREKLSDLEDRNTGKNKTEDDIKADYRHQERIM